MAEERGQRDYGNAQYLLSQSHGYTSLSSWRCEAALLN